MIGKKKRVVKDSFVNFFDVGDIVTKFKQVDTRKSKYNYWRRDSDGLEQRVYNGHLKSIK